jgi:phosphonate transport system substrate-binding protein
MWEFRPFIKTISVSLTVALSALVSVAEAKDYTFGIVPQFDARKLQEIWLPIFKDVEKRSGISLKFKGAKDIPAFEQEFTKGEYDFAYMNPYHMIVANRDQGYLPIVRDNGRKLYGIIVARKDSPLQKIEQLDGKIVAFPAPNALGAALIPRAEFARTFKIKISPKYVKSHTSVYLNVATGAASAGGGVQKTFDRQPENIRALLKVIYKTPKVEPHPIAVHPRVSGADVKKVFDALIAMGATEEGAGMLRKIPIKKVGSAKLADYDPIKAMGLAEFYVKN